MGQKWGFTRVGGGSQSHDGTNGSDKTHRARGVPEDLDVILGQQVAYHLGWRGPLGIQPGSGEGS